MLYGNILVWEFIFKINRDIAIQNSMLSATQRHQYFIQGYETQHE